MGQMDGTDELVLKILGDGGFDIADAVGQGLGFGSFVQVEKGDPGAVAGGVADGAALFGFDEALRDFVELARR